ncbi:MAG: sodium:alanine symporter family protein [Candidatus Eisenbacteria bacterium]|uniref:Sodium:alanine symporter family protein n=1 Tax=Eiseniibacteriota bacterium TaxID=2212470 RepID=A0A948RYP1_UNCEI|nr:sodium:alanine symporter family protein [Candidatus Eisenbacteria bacterium]MBU1949890.1 sodium:alanine symporter family protein [Candidatus Eisenbacteria bacterium]MBU2690664.1 sodium:alanine symporter family protein [Candidatus Eisenbacteria bacterium]
MTWNILEDIVEHGNTLVWSTPEKLPWLVVLLVGTGIFITVRLGGIQFRGFRHSIDVIRGKYDDPHDEGDINHFQALTTALSATVGVGNIAGVATAIHYGGPGAMFWMWITAIFGMALKYAECTLAMRYRTFDGAGKASGGPMYFIEKGLGKNFKFLAILFAVCGVFSSFGSGNMNQANTVSVSAAADFSAPSWIVGLILASLVALVILGGIRRIGNVTSRLAPGMAIIYSVGALAILVINAGKIPGVFAQILTEAFSPRASLGGTAAGIFSLTLLWGVKRGLFSNEAGQGSAPIAHAAAKTTEPAREGVVAMIGPFIDTIVICTFTGLVILSTGVWDNRKPDSIAPLSRIQVRALPEVHRLHPMTEDEIRQQEPFIGSVNVQDGVPEGLAFFANDGIVDNIRLIVGDEEVSGSLEVSEDGSIVLTDGPWAGAIPMLKGAMLQNSSALTAWAFQRGLAPFGNWGNLVVTLCVFLFALSTIISWSYYGDRCVEYLFGVRWVPFYKLFFVGFVFLGAVKSLEIVWAYGDFALGLMAVPNLIALVALNGKVRAMTQDYFSRTHLPIKGRQDKPHRPLVSR